MRFSLSVIFILLSCNLYAQTGDDTLRYREILDNTREDLSDITQTLQNLKRNYRNSIFELNDSIARLRLADSLQQSKIQELSFSNDRLKTELAELENRLVKEKAAIQEELDTARKGFSMFLLVLFSLLIIVFIYLLYRNYRLRIYVNEEVLSSSISMQEKHNRLKKKLKKRFDNFSGTIDKRIKKRLKKKK